MWDKISKFLIILMFLGVLSNFLYKTNVSEWGTLTIKVRQMLKSVSEYVTNISLGKNIEHLSDLPSENENYFLIHTNILMPFEKERIREIPTKSPKKVKVLMGTTYFSNSNSSKKDDVLCLDVFYSINNTVIIGDGYGHYPLIEYNRRIHKTTHETIKAIAQTIEETPTFDEIQKNILEIVQKKARIISAKYASNKSEECGFICAKITKNYGNGFEVIVVSAGDCAAIYYNEKTHEFKSLTPPIQYALYGKYDPVAATDKLSGQMLSVQKFTIPSRSKIILMTDGAWQSFKYTSSLHYDNQSGFNFIAYQIDTHLLSKEFDVYCEDKERYLPDFFNKMIEKNITEKKKIVMEIGSLLVSMKEDHWEFRTLKNFYDYFVKTDPIFSEKLKEFLLEREIPIESLENVEFDHFLKDVKESIYMGDDLLIAIIDPNEA